MEKITYRADIDGLRAIAVLSVVFYHADIGIFSGGYVGVDVFFVISGYLITNIIVREIEANEFSIIKFYERRVRRIYPALYTVIVFVLLAGTILYGPKEFMETGKSVIATTVFASNMLFWYQSGYFDAPSSLKPMLHTWSLAVEEQFYIVLPLLMLLIMRFAKLWLKPVLIMLALISFGFSIYYVNQDISTAFYFAHLRAWELLIGSLLAINVLPENLHPKLRNPLSIAGMIMILSSVFLYTHNISFPGESALLPTIGTALIIYSGMKGSSLIGSILEMPFFVFIGKISYSLYLWHWPIIVFGKYYTISPPTTTDKIIWLAAALILSTLSWKFIENPFRNNVNFSRHKIFAFGATAMAVSLMAGSMIYFYDGVPQRFREEVLATITASDSEWNKWEECIRRGNISKNSLCQIGQKTAAPTFMVWGDSHAQMFAPAINTSAQKRGVAGYLISANSCPPLLGVERPDRPYCSKHNDKVFEYIQSHPELRTVILTARWGWFSNGTPYKMEGGGNFTLVDNTIPAKNADGNAEVFETGLNRTVQNLLALNREVVIITPVPEIGYDVPSAYLIAIRTGRDINKIIAPTHAEFLDRNHVVFSTFTKLKDLGNIKFIEPSKILCNKTICRVIVNGLPPLYRDYNHLSTLGNQYVLNVFDPLFEQIP